MTRDLSAVPVSILRLPKDARGDPVPWFAKWHGSRSDLLVPGEGRFNRAVAGGRCWYCGERIGRVALYFVLGPAEFLGRESASPPGHADCAAFVVRGGFRAVDVAGVKAVYAVRKFQVFTLGNGDPRRRIRLGEPIGVAWWNEGRAATRKEVAHAILACHESLSPSEAVRDACARTLGWLPPPVEPPVEPAQPQA